MRVLTIIFALALGACSSIPVDQNLKTLAHADQFRITAELAHQEALADQRALAVAQCAKSEHAEACMLGLVAVEAVAAKQGYPQSSRLDSYRAPPTKLQQWGQFVGATSGIFGALVNGAVAIETNRQNQKTSRFISQANSDRETAIVGAVANLGGQIANGDPGLYVGGDYTGGDRTDTSVGRDQIGGDRIDMRTDTRTDNSGVIGDRNNTRIGSPGPIDQSDPGDDCTGSDCSFNPIVPAPPVDPAIPPG